MTNEVLNYLEQFQSEYCVPLLRIRQKAVASNLGMLLVRYASRGPTNLGKGSLLQCSTVNQGAPYFMENSKVAIEELALSPQVQTNSKC